MNLYLDLIKNKKMSFLISTILYTIFLSISVYIANSNSLLHFKIDPYIYGSKPLDFFFVLIVTIGFSYQLFYLKKNNLIDYIGLRITKKKYIRTHVLTTMLLVFLMVFIANVIAVVLSIEIAELDANTLNRTLSGFILGELQMHNPLLFGLIWSFYKAIIGAILCLFGQISAMYIKNLFLSIIFPFILLFLENFISQLIGIPQYSIKTSYVLNRLTCSVMTFKNIGICIVNLICLLLICYLIMREYYAKKY